MVASGGLYFLFYGAGDWSSATAAIGYARCVTPMGPCLNASTTGPWMSSHGQALGPSGPAVFLDAAGSMKIAYHAWTGGSAIRMAACGRFGSTGCASASAGRCLADARPGDPLRERVQSGTRPILAVITPTRRLRVRTSQVS